MRTAIYPGTFDPITNGHLDIIQRALRVVDKLVIGVASDTGKSPIFSLEQRTSLVTQVIEDELPDMAERVEIHSFEGLLVNFAQAHDAHLLIRGLRAVSDFEYEFQMACMNSHLAPNMETIFLTASESTHFVSSRFVKQIARLGGDVSKFVAPRVVNHLQAEYAPA